MPEFNALVTLVRLNCHLVCREDTVCQFIAITIKPEILYEASDTRKFVLLSEEYVCQIKQSNPLMQYLVTFSPHPMLCKFLHNWKV